MQADVHSGRKQIWIVSQRNGLARDRGILIVNFVHIMHLKASKRQTPIVNFPKKVHLVWFLELKLIIEASIDQIKWYLEYWGYLTSYEITFWQIWNLFCKSFWNIFQSFFVHLNFIIFSKRSKSEIICTKLTTKTPQSDI